MLVRYWMSTPAIAIDADAPPQAAANLMRQHNISFLPVMEDRTLAGIVTDRDLKRAASSPNIKLGPHEYEALLETMRVREIMSPHPITICDDLTMEEAAEILLVSKISGLPVTNTAGKLLGVITKSDIFHVIISLTGIGKRGIQFAFQALDRPGCIRDLTDAIRAYGGRVSSILSSYERVAQGHRRLFIRAYNIDRPCLDRLKEVLAQKATLLYLVDHRENRREIYG